MGKITLTEFITLDGIYQGPGGPEEDPRDGFDVGGWVTPYIDEGFGEFVDEIWGRPGAFLLGRRTYEIFAGYWPNQPDSDGPVPTKLNSLPKYVVSTTLETADWAGSTIIGEDIIHKVKTIKDETDGELQMHGSGALAQSLMSHDLIDTIYLLVFPVVLGKGLRLFADGANPTRFQQVEARSSSSGISMHTYELAGKPEYGTVGE
ncbi:MAG: dihydrofolate reductase [Acidimicrobiia bacterium]|nr:dihydrofolate reductase [Acidimicrobiia bacterium]